MDTDKLGVVSCLDKDVVEFCDEVIVACLYEGVLSCLEKKNKDGFVAEFLLVHPIRIAS